jgi:hypothetical protein
MMDIIIGKEADLQQKYALVCKQCHTHNGLATSEDYYKLSFYFLIF